MTTTNTLSLGTLPLIGSQTGPFMLVTLKTSTIQDTGALYLTLAEWSSLQAVVDVLAAADREMARLRSLVDKMQPVYDAALELRRVESEEVQGESIADLERNAPVAQRRTQAALTRFRTVVDAATPKEPNHG